MNASLVMVDDKHRSLLSETELSSAVESGKEFVGRSGVAPYPASEVWTEAGGSLNTSKRFSAIVINVNSQIFSLSFMKSY